jgi:hypothetical protein
MKLLVYEDVRNGKQCVCRGKEEARRLLGVSKNHAISYVFLVEKVVENGMHVA